MIIHLVNSSSDTSDICLLLGIKGCFSWSTCTCTFHGELVEEGTAQLVYESFVYLPS